jgi:hypothetical protein
MKISGVSIPTQFGGRYKTKREKEVTLHPGAAFVGGSAVGSAGLASLGGSALLGALGIAPMAAAAGSMSKVVPLASGAVSASNLFSIKTHEVKVPLTKKEELEMMTASEKAHHTVDKVLEQIKAKRKAQQQLLQQHKRLVDEVIQERNELEERIGITRPHYAGQSNSGRTTGAIEFRLGELQPARHSRNSRQRQIITDPEQKREIELQIQAKEKSIQQYQRIAEAAQTAFDALEQRLTQQEAQCYETREKIRMMESSENLLKMHQNVKDADTAALTPGQQNQKESMELEYHKVQVQLEEMSRQLQLNAEVNAALQTVS